MTLCIASYLLKTHQLLLFYPVVVNAVMLAVFGGSLWSSMPIVERSRRLREPALADTGVRYTRRVTQIWCAFFIINGGIALFTALRGDMSLWTAWNGMLSYLLMGTLMAGEWLVRRRVIKRYPMKQPLPLSEWLSAQRPAEMPIAWQEDCTWTLGHLRHDVDQLITHLHQQEAERWALCFENSYLFIVALLATLHAGKTPVIPSVTAACRY